MLSRRDALKSAGLVVASVMTGGHLRGMALASAIPLVKPPRIRQDATVGLINPAGATFESEDVVIVRETMAALGLRCTVGTHVLDRYGYLAGTDEARADDVNAMFSDDAVDAILAVRGGWGCNRILPMLDYESIRKNPKPLIGFSDITGLLLAIHAKTGMVTFHGPDGISTWNAFSTDWFRRVLMDAEAVTFANPQRTGDNLVQTADRIRTITPGMARGRLLGGNLSVLAAMMGSTYLPEWDRAILFVEDVGEDIYRVDRMLTQLKLAGVLDGLAGFVFGKCTRCGPGEGYGSLTIEEVLRDHVTPLNIPAYDGAMIGHVADKFTVPIGIEAELDADRGTIRLLESAVA